MAKEKKRKVSIITVIKSLLSGKILLLLGVDRLLPYILFLFMLGWVNIFLNYRIEQTLAKVEKNNEILEQYRNDYAVKRYEFVNASTKSTIKDMLEERGSEVTVPQKPAVKIKTR
ncbi:MAG: hypothetical protein E7115_04510 [Bacteroidales bacterium]|nr:hypothetical protein [Bacteroidales bacterium]